MIAPAFVNRMWAMLLGRGSVHPFELLDVLAEDFRRSNDDIRRLVTAVVSSHLGIRAIRWPEMVDSYGSDGAGKLIRGKDQEGKIPHFGRVEVYDLS